MFQPGDTVIVLLFFRETVPLPYLLFDCTGIVNYTIITGLQFVVYKSPSDFDSAIQLRWFIGNKQQVTMVT